MNDPPQPDPHPTQWSLIERARDPRSTVRLAAIDQLVRRYVPALRAHLLYRMKLDDATADDVVQGFLTEKFIERSLTAAADPSKGRFRSLVLKSLENYAVDMLRRKRRLAAGSQVVPDLNCVAVTTAPADVFDTAWAREILIRALRQMRTECKAQRCEPRWLLFERRLLRPLLEYEASPTYESLVNEFQFASPQQASNALVSAKRHFERVLLGIVGEYANGTGEIDREIGDLRAIVSAAGPLDLRLERLDDAVPNGPESHANDSSRGNDLLAGLFVTAGPAESPWSIEDFGGLWLHQLAQPLNSVLSDADPTRSTWDIPVDMQTVAELLLHARPPVELLQSLKEVARTYVRAGRNDFPNEIATALYFVSIAVALSKRRRRITKSDDSVLAHGLRLLLTRSWLDKETRLVLGSVLADLQVHDAEL